MMRNPGSDQIRDPNDHPVNHDLSVAALVRRAGERFRDGGVPDWRSSAEWLAMEAFACSRTDLLAGNHRVPSSDQVDRFENWVQRRLEREPVQYIVGYAEFCGLRVQVDRRVLIPRQETELLVEHAVEMTKRQSKPIRILDIGTGSGCIALAMARACEAAQVVGVDMSRDALDVARTNGEVLDLNVEWRRWDVFEPAARPFSNPFSMILSNPPYIPEREKSEVMPEVVHYEPATALFVGDDPIMFYRAIVDRSRELLLPGGYMVFEINPNFAAEIVKLVEGAESIVEADIELDLAGRQRIVWGRKDG